MSQRKEQRASPSPSHDKAMPSGPALAGVMGKQRAGGGQHRVCPRGCPVKDGESLGGRKADGGAAPRGRPRHPRRSRYLEKRWQVAQWEEDRHWGAA